MSEMKLSFRYAEKRDVPLILELIRELAGYEKLEEEVVATEEILEEWLFEKKRAEVIFPMADGVGEEAGGGDFSHGGRRGARLCSVLP